jgi:hypothetical protein
MRWARLTTPAVLALCAALAAAQEDKLDNPEFANWSKFKKGTSVMVKTTSTFDGFTKNSTTISTLVEVGGDKVVVEITTVDKFLGKENKQPPIKRDINKTVALPKGAKKEEFAGGKPPGTYEEGTETLDVGGAEVKAKWYKYRVDLGGTKIEAKQWTSDDVPGRVVKSEITTTGKLASTNRTEVTEIKKP